MRKSKSWAAGILVAAFAIGLFGFRTAHRAALDHRLIVAAGQGDAAVVRQLLNEGADPSARRDAAPKPPIQRLFDLLLHRQIFEAPVYPLTEALAAAPMNGNRAATVRLLIERGADPNVKTVRGMSALRMAGRNPGDQSLVALFLDHGADPDEVDRTGCTLLFEAVRAGNENTVRALLDDKADPNLANMEGDTPLMWAAYRGSDRVIAALLAHGARVNTRNHLGQTALSYLLSGPAPLPCLRALLASGANPNTPDAQGYSPFHYAIVLRPATALAMLAAGADARTPVPSSLSGGTVRLEIQMQTEYGFDSRQAAFPGARGATPLMLAVINDEYDVAAAILAKGVNLDARDATGRSALDLAADNPRLRALLRSAPSRP